MPDKEKLGKITDFLEAIGIPVCLKDLPKDTFLPGIRIEYGGLAIDLGQLAYEGDILHEAGHIACMAPDMRQTAFAQAGEDMGEEIASHAWSYAAALACKIPPEIVFHEDGYKGSADWLCNHYRNGGTNGVPLLQWFGMTTMPSANMMKSLDCFPVMKLWLRPMNDPTRYWQMKEDEAMNV